MTVGGALSLAPFLAFAHMTRHARYAHSHGRMMRCPNDPLRYLDFNHLGWRSELPFVAKPHDGFRIGPPASLPAGSSEYVNAVGQGLADPHASASPGELRQLVVEEFCGGSGVWVDREFVLEQ